VVQVVVEVHRRWSNFRPPIAATIAWCGKLGIPARAIKSETKCSDSEFLPPIFCSLFRSTLSLGPTVSGFLVSAFAVMIVSTILYHIPNPKCRHTNRFQPCLIILAPYCSRAYTDRLSCQVLRFFSFAVFTVSGLCILFALFLLDETCRWADRHTRPIPKSRDVRSEAGRVLVDMHRTPDHYLLYTSASPTPI
jgi:hypothetical protein